MRWLARPLSPVQLLLAALAIAAAAIGCCIAYSTVYGERLSPAEGLIWAAIHAVPWAVAFEWGKRIGSAVAKVIGLAGALAASLGLGAALTGLDALELELARRAPGLVFAALLLALVPAPHRKASSTTPPGGLPLMPAEIEWVGAAGNYVELHFSGRTLVHRASLTQVFAILSQHDFIQIHRSTLVRRDQIERVRRLDILLRDGTSLKIGKRYSSALKDDLSRPAAGGADPASGVD